MSADKCKHCHGSGWYEPKNMGGMVSEPCNRCDAHKTIQAAQKSSADVCPVCGAEPQKFGFSFLRACGKNDDDPFSTCREAERLAVERAAEIERLKAMLAPKWTDRRAFQLTSKLSGLICACRQIDRVTGIIDRLTLIQNLADSLALADMQKGDPSFLEFLNTLCREDRRNQQEK